MDAIEEMLCFLRTFSSRKIRHQERGSKHTANKTSRIKKPVQNASTSRASHIGRGGGGPKISSGHKKRPLETGSDDQSSSAIAPGAAKRVKTSDAQQHEPPSQSHSAVINQVLDQKLAVLIFGTGELAELGPLAPKMKGVHDEKARGRDTEWHGGKLQDIDAGKGGEEDDDDGADLNPLESTPKEISTGSFPPNTRFVQVAAGDGCSFALTDTGRVYGCGVRQTVASVASANSAAAQ
ncbi:hypothetical protein QQS21_009481 [Conoideocrella luteorostrata]|uniref:Uncharacterized protein n=1 Tax=Conoideocrella luteorostrata TaxID=1105319 RepID=A0AAJ0FVL2_9HYPO|nr:hypothetical protein QQS21_009481 [Conoideocrella luteorostrata]